MSINTDYLDYKLNTFFYSLSEKMWESFSEEIKEQARISQHEHELSSRKECEKKGRELFISQLAQILIT